MNPLNNDTIAAIATNPFNSGIGIIRISGSTALSVISKIFRSKSGRREFASHTINYGHVMDGDRVVDEVLVSVMKAPKTYTCEDVVEINCHGGMVCVNAVLELVLKNGVRLALPGEFTKRAFMNGRIDLTQAEAVVDVINATTETALSMSSNNLRGQLRDIISKLRGQISLALAAIETGIDYPEHEREISDVGIEEIIKESLEKINGLIRRFQASQLMRLGISTVILGRPNVGKSSLLNYLVGEERAIVTPTAGTTRDIITETVNVDGLPLALMDTAGIRAGGDEIEQIGIERAKAAALKAELLLVVIDGSVSLTDDDLELLSLARTKKSVVIVNKTDLKQKVDSERLKFVCGEDSLLFISLRNGFGVDSLFSRIKDMFALSGFDGDREVMVSARHKVLLESAAESLRLAYDGLMAGLTDDILSIDLMGAYKSLGEIVGEEYDDDIINRIFSEFCLGK